MCFIPKSYQINHLARYKNKTTHKTIKIIKKLKINTNF